MTDNNLNILVTKEKELKQLRSALKSNYNNPYYRDFPYQTNNILKKLLWQMKKLCRRIVRKLVKPIMLPVVEQQTCYNTLVMLTLDKAIDSIQLICNALEEHGDSQNSVEYSHPQRIIQCLPCLAHGDAIGNEVIAIRNILRDQGFFTDIYAETCTDPMRSECGNYSDIPQMGENDVLIYHFSIGCPSIKKIITNSHCKKIMIYHNITPSHFFAPYVKKIEEVARQGREELKELAPFFDYCLADSEYNAKEIRDLGVSYPVDVLPLVIPFEDYDRAMSRKVLNKYGNDDWVNILFVGRIAPNKKQEDVIRAFAYYKKNINPKSRLFLVGNPNGLEAYYQRLQDYIEALQVEDVIFPGHIGFDEILSYYNLADVFLCMSEHEGFCVPLVEAMYFDLPIIAYSAGAVPEVMGGSGVVVEKKDPQMIANMIDHIIKDQIYREELIQGERDRLKAFSYEKTCSLFSGYLTTFLEEADNVRPK